MNVFSRGDLTKIGELEHIRSLNFDVLDILSTYLNQCPCFITVDLVYGLVADCDISSTDAFVTLLLAACGLDSEVNARHAMIEKRYIIPAVKQLNTDDYTSNPYYQRIKIPEVKQNNWELTFGCYRPFEAFIFDDIDVLPDFTEIPHLGFFDKEFKFPVVLQNGNEWMAIKPNEVETMRKAINAVTGDVITFGLGLGYFAYMVSEKKQVHSISVVEKDEEVISLFTKYILPQFEHGGKVNIIKADAFEFVQNQMTRKSYDFAFVDLWHDVSDGFDMYLNMKRLEYICPSTKFLYWIEDSLLSHLRWKLFDQILLYVEKGEGHEIDGSISTFEQVEQFLSTPFLRKLAANVRPG